MRKLLLASVVAMPFTAAAHAELFNLGSTFNLELTNSPVTGTFPVTLTLGTTQLINGGSALLSIAEVPTAGGGEWLEFLVTTPNGTPFQNGSLNWGMTESGLNAAVPVKFDNGFNGAFTGATQATFTGSPFGNFSPGTVSTIGTSFGPGLYTNSTFSSPTGPGPIFDLFAFIDPFSIINNDGVDSANVSGWIEAWHFDPATPVNGVPEPASMTLLGLGVLGLLSARRRR